MKRSDAAEIVLLLVKAYPHVRCDEQTASIYELSLSELDAATCKAAVQRLITTSKFFPAIAEIREACTAQVHGRDYGQGTPRFRDPLIARCLGVWGSWNDLCGSPGDDPGGRARFIELYAELATRDRRDKTAGKALPAPANAAGPAHWLEGPRPGPRPVAQLMPPQVLTLVTRKPARAEAPTETVPRRWSATDLDAALNEPRKVTNG